MEKLVREPFFLHLSFMAVHQTQCSAVHTFTAEGGSCSECVLCIYLCFTCLLEHTGGAHRHRGPSFNFGQLLLLHLNPHHNWPPRWPNMHHQCIIIIVNVLVWLPGDFSNEAKLLERWSVTPWCNRSPPHLVPCCSVRSNQSTLAKTVLEKSYEVAQSYQQANIWLCRSTLIQTTIQSQTAWNGREIRVKQCRLSWNKWLKTQKRAMKTHHLTLDSKNICYLTVLSLLFCF